MKNGRKTILFSGVAVLLFTVIAIALCVPYKSAYAESEQDAEQFAIINKYNDGQAFLDDENNIVIESERYGQTVTVSNGDWYTDGIADYAVLDNAVGDSSAYVDYSPSNERFSVSYCGENGEYNIINAKASAELAESVLDNSEEDLSAVNKLIAKNPISHAKLQNTKTVTYNADGSADTNTELFNWVDLSQEDIDELRLYTDSKIKKKELKELQYSDDYYKKIDVYRFVPKKYFGKEARLAFIGKEYGFIFHSILAEVENVSFSKKSYRYSMFLFIFTIDREPLATEREYSVMLRPAIDAHGVCYHMPRGFYDYDDTPIMDVQVSAYSNGQHNMYLVDPIVSASINNLYDKNAFNQNYDLNFDRDISFAQTRINYNGYKGQFEKKKYHDADDVEALVCSLASDAFTIGTTLAGITINPMIGVFDAGYNIISTIVEFKGANELKYNQIQANNEKNIMTFSAPSQKPNKYAIASLSDVFFVKDRDAKTNVAVTRTDHYAQSIFVLNEVKKPAAISSYVNVFFGLGSPSSADRIYKYSIPERFNYSGTTDKLFDEQYAGTVNEHKKTDIYTFTDNVVNLNCYADNTGEYELTLKNFSHVIPYKESGQAPSDGKITLHSFSQITAAKERIFKNREYAVAGDAIKIRLSLKKGDNAVALALADCGGMPCFGAAFTAELRARANELECGKPYDYGMRKGEVKYFKFTAERDGVYTFSSASATMRFDILNSNRRVIAANVDCGDLFIVAGQSSYVRMQYAGSSNVRFGTLTVVQKDTVSGGFDGVIPDGNVGAWYPVAVAKSGRYDFKADGGVVLRLKDGGGREFMSGGQSAILDAGEYYMFASRRGDELSGAVGFTVAVEFKPTPMTANRVYTAYRDASFVFVAPVSGDYVLSGYSVDYSVTVNDAPYVGGKLRMTGSEPYEITLRSDGEIGTSVQIDFAPTVEQPVGFNTEFNAESVAFETAVSGEYVIAADGVGVYAEDMTAVNAVDGTYLLDANARYYIVNPERAVVEVVFYAKQIPVNTKFDAQADSVLYYRICPDTDGVYVIEAEGGAVVGVLDYGFAAAPQKDGGYALRGGAVYYVRVVTGGSPDIITVHEDKWDGALSVTDGLMFESVFSDANDRAQFTFTPDRDGLYKLVFYRDRRVDFDIALEGDGQPAEIRRFGALNFVLTFTAELDAGVRYSLNAAVRGEVAGSTVLAFGAYKAIDARDFIVYACGKPQNGGGGPNVIELTGDGGYTYSQVAVAKQFGAVNFSVSSAPVIDGAPAVTVNGSGRLAIDNRLAQLSAFSVEVNVGRCVYGDLTLDAGMTRTVSFVVYNKVVNIDIFDDSDACVTVVDVAPNSSVNLHAKVYPLFAAQASALDFYVADGDKQFIELTKNGGEARVFGKVTTPNNTYAKVYAACGNEFTVVVMVRVHAEEIYAYSASDLGAIDGGSTAYEIIVENESVGRLDLSGLTNVNYLKIRGGNVKTLDGFGVKTGGGAFVLVFEDIAVSGGSVGLGVADSYGVVISSGDRLAIYFSGNVALRGANGSLFKRDGCVALDVKAADLHQIGTGAVEICGGDGYGFSGGGSGIDGGNGGLGISSSGGTVRLVNVYDFTVRGGNGGSGSGGKGGTNATGDGANGGNGSDGGAGGRGGIAVACAGEFAISGEKIVVVGGRGGKGGVGGNGGNGGDGSKGETDGTDGGKGGDGGDGGNGGLGGKGGAALDINSKIYWQANWSHADGSDGIRGNGGNGGHGGRGGDGADDDSISASASHGGNGGNGGNGGDGYRNGRMGDGGDGGNGGDPGANGGGRWGGHGGYGYNGGNGGNGASTGWVGQKGGEGGNGGNAYGGEVGRGGKGGTGGLGAKDGEDGEDGQQLGEKHKA